MPLGRYPERVKQFREWSTKQVNDAKLSGSVTPSGRKRSSSANKGRKRRKTRKD